MAQEATQFRVNQEDLLDIVRQIIEAVEHTYSGIQFLFSAVSQELPAISLPFNFSVSNNKLHVDPREMAPQAVVTHCDMFNFYIDQLVDLEGRYKASRDVLLKLLDLGGRIARCLVESRMQFVGACLTKADEMNTIDMSTVMERFESANSEFMESLVPAISARQERIMFLIEKVAEKKLSECPPGVPSTQSQSLADAQSALAHRPVWNSSDVDFAQLFVELYKKGYIKGQSPTDVLNTTAPLFENVSPDGHNLWQGIQNRAHKSNRFSCIPEASKRRKRRTPGK